MKKAFVYLLFFSGLISLFSCEDTDYQIYDKNQKDKLFFTEDSVQFTYGLTRDQDVDLNLEVNLIGFVDLSQNKTFKVEIVKEKTTALRRRIFHVGRGKHDSQRFGGGVCPFGFSQVTT